MHICCPFLLLQAYYRSFSWIVIQTLIKKCLNCIPIKTILVTDNTHMFKQTISQPWKTKREGQFGLQKLLIWRSGDAPLIKPIGTSLYEVCVWTCETGRVIHTPSRAIMS